MGATDEAEGGRFELLAAVGEVADGTLAFQSTVERLLEIVVPDFADVAVLDAVGADGRPQRLGVRVEAPRRSEIEAALMRRNVLAEGPLAHAVRTSQSHLLSPVTERDLRAIAASEDDFQLLRSLELSSVLFVPLRARGRTLGGLVCGVGLSGRRYEADHLRFAEVLSGRISLALDNAGLSRMVGELEQRLEPIFTNLAEAVIVRDLTGGMAFANQAAADLLGFDSVDDMRGASSEEMMARFEAFDESGRRLNLADLPSSRALAGEPAAQMLVRNVSRQTGTERWLLHKATPVLDEDGHLSMVVNVIEDVTETKRAEMGQRFLAESGRELSSSLDYEQTLQRVADLAVPQLADWCGVSIRGPYDELENVAVAHVDPAKVALAREFAERMPTRMSDPGGAAEVVRSGRAQLVREITPEMIDRAEVPEERAALVRNLEMRSVIIAPLAVPGQPPLGALTLVMAESGRLFQDRDLALTEELGRRAAVAVENARLYTERSRIASTLQQSLLPEDLPQIDGYRLASLYRAAGEENEVGGDFYDAFAISSGWVVLVGDVTGRGPHAAALTSLARYTMRTAARLLDDPVAALAELNAELRDRSQPSLVTIACAVLRETSAASQADVVLAGHPPPYHVRDGVARQVGSFASPLGAYEDDGWRTETVTLEPGDQLILYTDGVTDTVGRGERFGEARLGEVLSQAAGAADAVRRVDQALKAFAEGPQADDTAVLALERVPAPTSAATPSALLIEGAGPVGST